MNDPKPQRTYAENIRAWSGDQEVAKPERVCAEDAQAERLWHVLVETGLANDLRGWRERNYEQDGWRTRVPAIDEKTRDKVRLAVRTLQNNPGT